MEFEIWNVELGKSRGIPEGKEGKEDRIKSEESPNFAKLKKILGIQIDR